VHKMQWLETASIDKEYCTVAVYLDKKEEVDRLLMKMAVEMANGELYSAVRSGTSARKMLPLLRLWTFTLPLQGTSSYLWIVCPS